MDCLRSLSNSLITMADGSMLSGQPFSMRSSLESETLTSDQRTATDNNSSISTMQSWKDDDDLGEGWRLKEVEQPLQPQRFCDELGMGWISGKGAEERLKYFDVPDYIELPNGDLVQFQIQGSCYPRRTLVRKDYKVKISLCNPLGEPVAGCQWLLDLPDDKHGPGVYVGRIIELLKEQAKELKGKGVGKEEASEAVKALIRDLGEAGDSSMNNRSMKWSELSSHCKDFVVSWMTSSASKTQLSGFKMESFP